MKNSILFLVLSLCIISCKKEINSFNEQSLSLTEKNSGNDIGAAGYSYVYTESNDAGTNHIFTYIQNPNGRLSFKTSVASGGAGTGALFGSQGALVLNENHTWLYAVNAGSNSVSSFRVGNDGGLTLASTVASGGTRPVSVTVSNNFLYVVNQVSANINGYTIGANGSLTVIPSTNLALSAPTADPGQISFHPNGQLLYVTERGTDKITSFQVNNQGVAASPVVNAASGLTPFGFDFAQGHLVASHAFLDIAGLGGAGSYSLSNSGGVTSVNGSVPNNQTATCWAAATDDGRFVYFANSFSDNLTSYTVAENGALQLFEASAAQTGQRPRDVVIVDNRFLYVLNVTSHTISEHRRLNNGTLKNIGNISGVPVWAAGLAAY